MNKNIIVTGAAKGIGRAIAERLSKEGYFIIAIDMDIENGKKLEDELKGKLEFHHLDISNETSVEDFFWKVIENHSTLYAIVNNAGIIRDNMIWNMTSSDFDSVIDVNLKGTWLMCREAAKIMKVQSYGRIINIASRAWLGNRGQSNYSASKAGVVGLTRVLALELGKHNVLVNAVAPGLIDTPMTQKLDEAVLKKLIDAQPTRTMGKPEDIANTVAFLASPQTSFITGQTIYVDGGKSIGAGV
jgi:NAD(P)-dependent dehydrogenase (short-subunit alcohol dehydrogenase family)